MILILLLLIASATLNCYTMIALGGAKSDVKRLEGVAVVNGRTIDQLESNKIPKSPKPVCLCDHGINFHDLEAGTCKAVDNCRCMRYTGPEPLPEIYHPLEIGR